jgi:hypothetical protein
MMAAIAAVAVLLAWSGTELHRRWNHCQNAASRCDRAADTRLAAATRNERAATLIDALLRGDDVDRRLVAKELPPEIDPASADWSPTFARQWRKVLLDSAAVDREKASMHREKCRFSRRAFWDPWNACVLVDDL